MKVWDSRDLSKNLCKVDIDQAAGVIVPYYDVDTKVLFLCGKGDGNIRYYEMKDCAPWAFPLSEYRSSSSAKGCCFIPKRARVLAARERENKRFFLETHMKSPRTHHHHPKT